MIRAPTKKSFHVEFSTNDTQILTRAATPNSFSHHRVKFSISPLLPPDFAILQSYSIKSIQERTVRREGNHQQDVGLFCEISAGWRDVDNGWVIDVEDFLYRYIF